MIANEPVLLGIGQLARRTGVPARTIRFWADEGVLPPTDRTAAGHRRFDASAVARLDLVRTLRALGMGLDDVRAVLARRRGIRDVAAAHVEAIDAQLRDLRIQRAVCTVLARGEPDERTTILMNDLARLSATERRQVIDEFVDATFAGTDPDAPGAGIATAMRSLPTELPDDPSTEQVAAWVELAELVRDESFRARVRAMAVAGANPDPDVPQVDPAAVTEHAGAALSAGTDPAAPGAQAVLARIGVGDLDPAVRTALADHVERFTDGRVQRYWTLLAILKEWPEPPSAVREFLWFAAALRGAPVR